MSRLSEIFQSSRKCFIPFVTAGYPDLETTKEIVIQAAENGADVVELGIPFSDPVADGPIIQRSSYAALQHGYTMGDYLDLVRRIRERSAVGLIFMSYLNPVLKYGLARLDAEARSAGLDGLLLSDLTPEGYEQLGCALQSDVIFLAAPTSSDARLERICAASRGFLYLVARTGVTGTRTNIESLVPATLARIRKYTSLPVAVGFGVSSRDDVAKVWEYADGAIVGSAIVKFIQDQEKDPELAQNVGRYIRSFLPEQRY